MGKRTCGTGEGIYWQRGSKTAKSSESSLNVLLSPHVKSHVEWGSVDKSNSLGIRRMPDGYALMLNAGYSHYYWLRHDGEESVIHWDRWAIYKWAKYDQEKTMSSKAAKRRAEYKKREEKRQQEKKRQEAIRNANDIESLAKAMGVPLR